MSPRGLVDLCDIAKWQHWTVVGVALALPWSTSVVGILMVVWLLFSTLRVSKWRAVLAMMRDPAGALPVFLFVVALGGTFWSDASAMERWQGLVPFARLLTLPILMAQYRENDRSAEVFVAFLFSCTVLLLVSLALNVLNLPGAKPGIPVKDYISQSLEFVVCAAVLIESGMSRVRTAVWFALGLFTWAGIFLGDILFVATARTSLFVIVALGCVLGFRTFRWKGAFIGGLVTVGALSLLAVSSLHLRDRMLSVPSELKADGITSSKERLVFWQKSVGFIASAPAFGHGTGSIPALYRTAATNQKGVYAEESTNPHNQMLTIGVQLGMLGIWLLWFMWTSHFLLFKGHGSVMLIGTVLVVQNCVGSAFNSLLFDFTSAWIYIVGIGVAGGAVFCLADRKAEA